MQDEKQVQNGLIFPMPQYQPQITQMPNIAQQMNPNMGSNFNMMGSNYNLANNMAASNYNMMGSNYNIARDRNLGVLFFLISKNYPEKSKKTK